MKILLLLACFCLVDCCQAQILKKIGNRVKEDVEWRARRKAGQKIDQGLDSLAQLPAKAIRKKNKTKDDSPSQESSPQAVKASAPADDGTISQKEGHVLLELSADRVFTGGSILISGESIRYKNFTQVNVTVRGEGSNDSRNITLTAEGKYQLAWNSGDKPGTYTITVSSSDKKSDASATVEVVELETFYADDWPADNIKVTKEALDGVVKAFEKVETRLGAKDKAELEQKIKEVKSRANELLNMFAHLKEAGKDINRLSATGKSMPANLRANLSDLNNALTAHANKMKNLQKQSKHQPQDNTVCEYLVIAGEACAAFSAVTNFWASSIHGILKNIMLDKVSTKPAEVIISGKLKPETEWGAKESSKIFATAYADAGSLATKLGTAGLAGDLVQFASDVLLRKYCGQYKGSLQHDYTVIFRNGNGETWWKYGVEAYATLNLRYPKDQPGSIIKMKGNIEGNGTKFTFFQNLAVEDEFKRTTKKEIEILPLKVITPFAIKAPSTQYDILGFGAAARAALSPAYFNIPVDAEYNPDDGKIRIFINTAIIDFSPAVVNQFVFLMYGGDMLPYFKRMQFPIHKLYRTLSSVFHQNNEFVVKMDKGTPAGFTGKASKHIGSPSDPREHFLNFTISAKKD